MTLLKKTMTSTWSRRDWFRISGTVAAANFATALPGTAAARLPLRGRGPDVYSRIGVRPFISCTATTTINGGSSQPPEVLDAVFQAGHYHVNLDELMAKVGPRIAELLQVDAAMVSSGAAAAVTCGTLACVAGRRPREDPATARDERPAGRGDSFRDGRAASMTTPCDQRA